MKTLKDFYKLENAIFSNKGEKEKGFSIDSKELKTEVSKWIMEDWHELNEFLPELFEYNICVKVLKYLKKNRKNWLHRFNLKIIEEDNEIKFIGDDD